MYSLELQDLLKVLISIAFIYLIQTLRRKWGKPNIKAGGNHKTNVVNSDVENKQSIRKHPRPDHLEDSTAVTSFSDKVPEDLRHDPTKNESENGFMEAHQTLDNDAEALCHRDPDGEYETNELNVSESASPNNNKAIPFTTEETPAANFSNDSSNLDIAPPNSSANRQHAAPSSHRNRASNITRDDNLSGYSSAGHSRREGILVVSSSRAGSNNFQIRRSPPSYEEIATEFYGAGPIFHSWDKIGPNGGTIAIAGCGILVPRHTLTDEMEVNVMCCYPEFPFKSEGWMAITPDVFMGPPGLQFQPKLAFSVPTFFEPTQPTHLFWVKIQKRVDQRGWQDLKIAQYSFTKKILFDVDHSAGFRALVGRNFEDRLVKKLYYVGFLKRFNLRSPPDTHFLVLRVCNDLPHNIKYIEAEMQTGDYEVVIHPGTIALRKNQSFEVSLTSNSRNVQVDFSTSRFRIGSNELWLADTLHCRMFQIRRDHEGFQGWVNLKCNIKVSSVDNESHINRSLDIAFYWLRTRLRQIRRSTTSDSLQNHNTRCQTSRDPIIE